MRLLNTSTFIPSEFVGSNIPPYAILSHRWETEEITFQDLPQTAAGPSRPKSRSRKKGWTKIEGCCEQAHKDKFEWVWIDSCCIDKTSSAELSEAINSMFKWYQKAGKCYAFLSDVEDLEGLRGSKWFTRGWTLQELLGPELLVFFNRDWEKVGSKDELRDLVSEITAIEDLENFEGASVAQKMSWAAMRETTRIEDRAYSLMGLLGVSMPPIYGEGEEAFIRLQLELLKISDDESIFAWRDKQDETRGLLARSPDAFRNSGSFRPLEFDYNRPPYAMTNKGLRIESHLLPSPLGEDEYTDDIELFALQCGRVRRNGEAIRLAVRLKYVQGDLYARISSSELISLSAAQTEELGETNRREPRSRQVFHVKQLNGPCLLFQGPYTFSVNTSSIAIGILEWHVSRPVRGQWMFSNDAVEGEQSLKLVTGRLPQAGMTAALMLMEVDLSGKETELSQRFVVVLDIIQHKVNEVVLIPPDDTPLETIMETLDKDPGAYTSGLNVSLRSGKTIMIDLKELVPKTLNYEVGLSLIEEENEKEEEGDFQLELRYQKGGGRSKSKKDHGKKEQGA